jgi:hypothetical protein
MNTCSLPPTSAESMPIIGDILIQVLCNKTIAQWVVAEVKGEDKFTLQLIDKNGRFTNKYKVVRKSGIGGFIKDGLATRLMNKYRRDKRNQSTSQH